MIRFISIICIAAAAVFGASSIDEWRILEQAETLKVFHNDRVVGTLVHSVRLIDSALAVCVTTTLTISKQESGVSQMELLEQRWYNVEGGLRNARQTMKSPIGVNTWTLAKTNLGWQITVEAGGVSSSNIIDDVRENLRPTLDLYQKVKSLSVKTGDTWVDTMTEIVSGRPVTTTYRCKEVDRLGKIVTIEVRDDLAKKPQKWRLDAHGKTLMQEIEGVFVAKKMDDAGTSISPDGDVDISELADILNLRKNRPAGPEERIALVFLQKMTVDESVASLYVRRGNRWVLSYPEKKCVGSEQGPLDSSLKKWTIPTPTLQSDNPAIAQCARREAGSDSGNCAVIESLNRYVFTSLEKRNTATFSSALETLKAGFGDCGEHTALLAALLRSRGIPARVVLGLCYYSPKKAYVGHAWVMAWAGQWLFADPAFGIFPACSDRVPLIIDDTGRKMVDMAKYIGRIEIEYVRGK
jgi:hypothetical protein